ncbi:hypothetical protein DH2020_027042 [Rehmannia glutinosa]|uniref:LysM domain receptor-like kinase 3 n=1 Tax=Rehmannia glutinosa TaxID=99300 RepID=A0ABR0VV66_REHGL
MACQKYSPLFFLLPIFFIKLTCAYDKHMYPFTCSDKIKSCNALLFQHNNFQKDQIASLYSVNASEINPVLYSNKQDYLVPVNCSCKNVGGAFGYFYDVVYKPKANDTFYDVSNQNFSGQLWDGGDSTNLTAGVDKIMHLLCGCVDNVAQVVVTYTVQAHDTLSTIATLLSAEVDGIENLNTYLAPNPSYIETGWLLYVPMEKYGVPGPKKGAEKLHKWTIIIGVLSGLYMHLGHNHSQGSQGQNEEIPKAFSKNLSTKSHSLHKKNLHKQNMEDMTVFESEKPTQYNIEEIAESTNDFDETRKIGQGGYGSVYYGVIGEKEVAIKKMRSNKSKEFLAELKVLCKIHHINVVELLGYASGDDHLYLVYEYIPNGSLGDHLHDPLLKDGGLIELGHQPLSWTARTQVALDAARGIEYIHDHTKAQYVHRDIKTTNILLDEGLRAKVADFGLAKLVGRTNEDDLIATRLVGTPGYLPPESVKELQVTIKTDVFAFGVVLAELITGQRALIRDNQEPNRMKSLITVVNNMFKSEDPESALESIIDGNLKGNYPPDDVYKMAEIAEWCLSEEAIDRPQMREVVDALSRIRMSSIEWEASLGGSSQIFSGVFSGR